MSVRERGWGLRADSVNRETRSPQVPDPNPPNSIPNSVNRQTRSPHQTYRCHQCNMRFPNKSLLTSHQLNHQIGHGGRHPDPYNDQNAPWIKPGGIDEELRHVYRSNRPLILEILLCFCFNSCSR